MNKKIFHIDLAFGLFSTLKSWMVIIFFVLPLTRVNAQESCLSYFPLIAGAQFEITKYKPNGKAIGKAEYTVISTSDTSDGFTLRMRTTLYRKKDQKIITMDYDVRCRNGFSELKLHCTFDMDPAHPTYQVYAAKQGNWAEWTYDVSRIKLIYLWPSLILWPGETTLSNRKVEGKESIATPAGTFDCIKLSYKVQTKILLSESGSAIEWYAADVGIVKTENYNDNGKMIGYSLMTKLSR